LGPAPAATQLRYSIEFCTPVWCRSAHTRLIDPAINDALRIVTGFLRPTPADNLPILAGIQPAELRRNGVTLSLARPAMEPGHLRSPIHRVQMHGALTRDTHLYPPHNSLVHLTTTYVQRTGRITNGMRSGRQPVTILTVGLGGPCPLQIFGWPPLAPPQFFA